MKCALGTGAAGFVGHRLVAQLLDQGVQVVGLDNFNHAYARSLKEYRHRKSGGHPQYAFFHADTENLEDLGPIFARHSFDAVFNLVARAGVRNSIEKPHVYFETNVTGVSDLLESMKQNNCSKLIQASTLSLYSGQPMPFHEDLPVDEPLSPDAASK